MVPRTLVTDLLFPLPHPFHLFFSTFLLVNKQTDAHRLAFTYQNLGQTYQPQPQKSSPPHPAGPYCNGGVQRVFFPIPTYQTPPLRLFSRILPNPPPLFFFLLFCAKLSRYNSFLSPFYIIWFLLISLLELFFCHKHAGGGGCPFNQSLLLLEG